MRTRILTAVLAAAALAVSGPAHAQSKTGTTIGAFLNIEPGARLAAMGNAGASVGEGLDAVYYNAAAIGRLDRYAVYFTHSEWLAGIGFDYVAGVLPVAGGRQGAVFGSITALGSGEMDVRTVSQPLGTGERFKVTDIALSLGYGREITDRFVAGGLVTYAQETIWHSSAGMVTFSLGTLYRVSDNGLRIGASLSNFGTNSSYDGRDLRTTIDRSPDTYGDNGQLPAEMYTDEFALPVTFRVGLGMPWRLGDDLRLLTAIDAAHPSDNSESVSLGAELDVRRMLALRLGYQNLFMEDSEVGLTAGAGLRGKLSGIDYRLDYAWADQGRLGSSQRFSLGLVF